MTRIRTQSWVKSYLPCFDEDEGTTVRHDSLHLLKFIQKVIEANTQESPPDLSDWNLQLVTESDLPELRIPRTRLDKFLGVVLVQKEENLEELEKALDVAIYALNEQVNAIASSYEQEDLLDEISIRRELEKIIFGQDLYDCFEPLLKKRTTDVYEFRSINPPFLLLLLTTFKRHAANQLMEQKLEKSLIFNLFPTITSNIWIQKTTEGSFNLRISKKLLDDTFGEISQPIKGQVSFSDAKNLSPNLRLNLALTTYIRMKKVLKLVKKFPHRARAIRKKANYEYFLLKYDARVSHFLANGRMKPLDVLEDSIVKHAERQKQRSFPPSNEEPKRKRRHL